jgi:CheY-like chemotaxis protein
MSADFPILQVEDDENDILFLQHAFAQAAITNPLQLAKNGQEAIDYLSGAGKFADRLEYPVPGLVLLDLKLPRISGLEVLHWLRHSSKLPRMPVIVFSSSAHRQDVETAYAAGANSFLVKPSSLEKRIELARLIKGYWLEFNEPAPEV